MYVPDQFAISDVEAVAEFVDSVGAADIVTFDGARLVSSLVPVIWDRTHGAGGFGRLLAHISVANSQWRTANTEVPALAIVHGPQAYISPSWYPSKREHGRAVPTWNYSAVHFTGPILFHTDREWLRELVTHLTDRHEESRADRWQVTDAPSSWIEGQLRGIVGVEIAVTAVEAKAKLSQNRSVADRLGVIDGLSGESGPGAAQIAASMQAQLGER
ncbi:MAG: FMN-binding negative transcriptional regulator [Acidothermaceae bacterium]